ncbi:penicillin-insensitive murein endopeptidase [Chromatium okenii]|uniref:penicillin-insensitive murein endopeptidase n=1 Tax=Chromatium okenii TaxID=61644 RepID=UPI002413A5E4|nr:penicillin-insensitive murein endopeptidase [Chromatium okenii]
MGRSANANCWRTASDWQCRQRLHQRGAMLPESSDGYVNVRRYRNRSYGHPSLLRFINDMGRAQQQHSNC